MQFLNEIWRVGRLAFLAATGWFILYGTAWAQAQRGQIGKKEEAAAGPVYVIQYALVILCVGLGLFIVCRSSNRRDRARPELYDEVRIKLDKNGKEKE
jgi:hypothetical protein